MAKPRIPYFKFYPSDFMHGVRGMSAQEVGVYTMMLCRLYEEDGPIEMNTLRLSTYCGMRENTFKTVLQKLVDLGKLDVENGMISNRRAASEMASRSDDLKNKILGGKASAEKRQRNQRKRSTGGQQTVNYTDTDTLEIEAKASSKKGTRLPDDFKPDQEWSKATGLSSEALVNEFHKFRDYWSGKSGKDATKLDWQATWRNWIRNSKAFEQRNLPSTKPKTVGESFYDLAVEMGIVKDEQGTGSQSGLFDVGNAGGHGPVLDLAHEPAQPGGVECSDFTRRLLRGA